MGITLMTFSGLFAPLQQLAGWLASAPQRQRGARLAAGAAQSVVPACAGAGGRASWRPAGRSALPARRPLRVLRVAEGCQAAAGAGRMVISGRMADVCAELDRLAALEAQAGGGRRQAREPIR